MHEAAETIPERVARNQSTFRDANERIERAAEQVDIDRVPFICECLQRDCTQLTRLSLEEYEMIRSDGRRFLVAPGHEICEVDGKAVARVIERSPLFSVLEKVDEAGRVARDLDPRR
jgi:hypothetical protein